MKRARMDVLGKPEAVLRVEPFELGELGPGCARVQLEWAPIDPMDLLSVRGLYPIAPTLPATPGAEGAGRVVAAASGVALALGTPVVLPIRAGSWASHVDVSAQDLVAVPESLDLKTASMLRVDALSALAILEEASPGSTLVHAPGGGSVGRFLVQLAPQFEVRVIALSEREERLDELRAAGAVAALKLDAQAPGKVHAFTKGARAGLAIDGIGGRASAILAACVADGGTLLSYGAVSREAPVIPVMHPVFRDVRMRGFWLNRCTQAWGREGTAERVRRLADAQLQPEIAATYPLSELHAALRHAKDRARRGRVLLQPAC